MLRLINPAIVSPHGELASRGERGCPHTWPDGLCGFIAQQVVLLEQNLCDMLSFSDKYLCERVL